ncbi:hypothetical protein [Bermanella sp. R86510]|uniref:hypothetical protein n=1 Tax=unclassified Bermanella TaxID=2627862 RepID=UPI0037CB3F4E
MILLKLYKSFFIASLLMVMLITSGCITTKIKAYNDTSYELKPIGKIVVFAKGVNQSVHTNTVERVKQKLKYHQVEVLDYWDVVSPLNEEAIDHSKALEDAGVEAVLIMTYSFGRKDSSIVGTYTTNSYTSTANGGYSSGLAIPISSSSLDSGGEAQLINVSNQKAFWLGQLSSSSSGSYYTKTKKHVLSMVDKTIRTLIKEKYFIKSERN